MEPGKHDGASKRLGPWTLGWLAFVALSTLSGCDFLVDKFGLDEVTRVAVDVEVPVTVRLPPRSLPGAPRDYSAALTVGVQVDVIQALRDKKRHDDADLLEENQHKIQEVILNKVEYEVREPNHLEPDVNQVVVYIAPIETKRLEPVARELGRTNVIKGGIAAPPREMEYAAMGLADASDLIKQLRFAVLIDMEVDVPRDVAVDAEALILKLRLYVKLVADVAA